MEGAWILLCIFQKHSIAGPLVETNVGKIRGVNSSDGDYAMYLGIPYGQVQADNPFGVS